MFIIGLLIRGDYDMGRIFYNGETATNLLNTSWQKSHRSNSQGNCVEVGVVNPEGVERWRYATRFDVTFELPELHLQMQRLGEMALAA
jgi:Domain of unknown function (DUF397)